MKNQANILKNINKILVAATIAISMGTATAATGVINLTGSITHKASVSFDAKTSTAVVNANFDYTVSAPAKDSNTNTVAYTVAAI